LHPAKIQFKTPIKCYNIWKPPKNDKNSSPSLEYFKPYSSKVTPKKKYEPFTSSLHWEKSWRKFAYFEQKKWENVGENTKFSRNFLTIFPSVL